MECLGTHICTHIQRHFVAVEFFLPVVLWYGHWINVVFLSLGCFFSYCSVLDCLWTFITGPSVVSSGHWPSLKRLSFSTSGALIKQTTRRRRRHADPPRPIKRDSDTRARHRHRSPKCIAGLICSPTSSATASVERDHIPEPLALHLRQRAAAGLHPYR